MINKKTLNNIKPYLTINAIYQEKLNWCLENSLKIVKFDISFIRRLKEFMEAGNEFTNEQKESIDNIVEHIQKKLN